MTDTARALLATLAAAAAIAVTAVACDTSTACAATSPRPAPQPAPAPRVVTPQQTPPKPPRKSRTVHVPAHDVAPCTADH
ncbi:hypothetical protein [Streptomyces chryseus]